MLIEWSDEFSVGSPVLDAQHMQIVNAINTLHDAMMNGRSVEVMVNLIQSLEHYAEYHFDLEEELLLDLKYPFLGQHCADHEQFRDTIHDLRSRYQSGEVFIYPEALQFLSGWFTEHVLGSDMHYKEYFEGIGIKLQFSRRSGPSKREDDGPLDGGS